MPKGNETITPLVARPTAEVKDGIRELCLEFGKSHTDFMSDAYVLFADHFRRVWGAELEAVEKARQDAG